MILVLSGPTASGKSRLAVELAKCIGGEIINADSRQFYREMVIGTAKPSHVEQSQVPHHLVDVASIQKPWSVADFVREAELALQAVRVRGKVPIICGGTGMYVRALVHGLDEIPTIPPEKMTQLMTRFKTEGLAVLYEELRQKDPDAAVEIGKTNTQRILRALAVLQHTGKSIRSYWTRTIQAKKNDALMLFLDVPREILNKRIDTRVDEMLQCGLVAEAQTLHANYPHNQILAKTIGYAEFLQHGFASLQTVSEAIKQNTRQFAKRQVTWWRGEKQALWIPATDGKVVLEAVLEAVKVRQSKYDGSIIR